MRGDGPSDLALLVEPDRVHRSVYNDPAIFDMEMDKIFETVWIYCGHESQVKRPGDYWTMQVGRQPMVMVRHGDGSIRVLFNRCPHRGSMVCGARHGNTGKVFTCSYHSWQFHTDGTLESFPLPKGYEGTRLTPDNPDAFESVLRDRTHLGPGNPRQMKGPFI